MDSFASPGRSPSDPPNCPGIPVLLVGGLLDDDRLENWELLEGLQIFPKPFQAAELLEKVKEALVKHCQWERLVREEVKSSIHSSMPVPSLDETRITSIPARTL
jgi:hypothetical protein